MPDVACAVDEDEVIARLGAMPLDSPSEQVIAAGTLDGESPLFADAWNDGQWWEWAEGQCLPLTI